jgi:DNA-binding NtrC family response regulator
MSDSMLCKNDPQNLICSRESGRILVVDDELDFARGLRRLISGEFPHVECVFAGSGEEALAELTARGADLMITDLRMPGMDGLTLLSRALQKVPAMAAVVLTAHGDIETAVEAVKIGAYDFLTKPLEIGDLFCTVRRGLERSRLTQENVRLRNLLEHGGPALVGDSPAMTRLRTAVAAVAANDYPVLIRGESGSGKELVVRLIHSLSPRAVKPCLSVDCPAIPENLLESELFGHEKGAFTGADRSRRGLFQQADGGTLHLDEIGDISHNVQIKLLRALQEQEIRPVGGDRTLRVNVRVLASTNQHLEEKIAGHSFREDLYYRLNVLSVTVPPLRDRIEDIPLLAQYFLKQICNELRTAEKMATPEVLEWLKHRQWPGNVRELQNIMRRLAVFCTGEVIDLQALRQAETGHIPVALPTRGRIQPYKDAKSRLMNQFTGAYVRDLLGATGGNISEAARMSGLSRVALQKIISRMNIDTMDFKS